MTHPGGRPQEYDRIKIGKDFVKWATNNPEALTVPMFCVSIGLHSGIFRNWSRETEEFRALFLEGKEQIGINRLRSSQSGLLDSSIYRAHVGNYDTDINEYMREEKKFDSDLRKQEEGVKQTNITLQVPHGLAIGSNLPTAPVSDKGNPGS
jgi:hypothetical protein